jgi:hypothetical protein
LLGRRESLVRLGQVENIEITEQEIALAINEPNRDVVRGFPPMPKVALAPGEADILVQYIKQLK